MADITIFKPAAVTVTVIDGVPPVDQSAEVAALTAQVATLQSNLALSRASLATANAKIAAALAALA